MKLYYAGIGSRSTPLWIQKLETEIAIHLDERGWVLRSGGAEGSDSAFEKGAIIVEPEIYLPWRGFNDNRSRRYRITPEAMEVARRFHPAWERLSPGARKLMARNSYQVLGEDLDTPSHVVIAYTKEGKGQGGTGQALRIAKKYEIPIIDLGKYNLHPDDLFKVVMDRIKRIEHSHGVKANVLQ